MLDYQLDLSNPSIWITVTPYALSYQLPFYMTEVGIFQAGKDYFTERDSKNTYLLLYTLSGEGSLLYMEDTYVLKQASVIIIDCNNYHYYKPTSTEPWIFRWIHFNGSCAQTYAELIMDGQSHSIAISEPLPLESAHDKLLSLSSVSDLQASIATSNYLSHIITHIVSSKFNETNTKNYRQHRDGVDKVIHYISQNYNQEIGLDDFVALVHLSKYYFLKIFKQHTGMTPYDYLINYRINEAKVLLKTSSLTVGEIAFTVGFLNESNFIKQFKRIAYCTPLHYRRTWK